MSTSPGSGRRNGHRRGRFARRSQRFGFNAGNISEKHNWLQPKAVSRSTLSDAGGARLETRVSPAYDFAAISMGCPARVPFHDLPG
jgi:hypothetical protein